MTSSLALVLSVAGMVLPSTPSRPAQTKIPSDGFLREAEIKHGRVAMVSAATLGTLSALGVEHPAQALSSSPASQQILFFSLVGLAEAATYLPRFAAAFSLKDGIVPGVFPPGRRAEEDLPALVAEDVAGRAAMLATAAFLVLDGVVAR